ncbi:MAG: hypothetical protein H7Y04_03595 [Verrucomicrobia bacterium]|nr:hypothetical protein [Cytophagales bacterium]
MEAIFEGGSSAEGFFKTSVQSNDWDFSVVKNDIAEIRTNYPTALNYSDIDANAASVSKASVEELATSLKTEKAVKKTADKTGTAVKKVTKKTEETAVKVGNKTKATAKKVAVKTEKTAVKVADKTKQTASKIKKDGTPDKRFKKTPAEEKEDMKETAASKSAEKKVKDKVTGNYKGKKVYTGPRGGTYYINKNGNKTYISDDK